MSFFVSFEVVEIIFFFLDLDAEESFSSSRFLFWEETGMGTVVEEEEEVTLAAGGCGGAGGTGGGAAAATAAAAAAAAAAWALSFSFLILVRSFFSSS